jgi:Holliday junction resolvasome RuvABC endonuclease subunit
VTAHVLGLDLALAHAGAARIHQDGRVQTWLLDTDALPADATLDQTSDRMTRVVRWALSRATRSTALAVIEEVPRHADTGNAMERAAIFWDVVHALRSHGIPVGKVNPRSLKARVVGRADASKRDVARTVARLWPNNPGLDRVSGDEADATALATLGVIKLDASGHQGWPKHWLEARALAIDTGAQWPELTP